MASKLKVCHVLGSASSAYYEGLSTMYAGCCAEALDEETNAEFEFHYAVLSPTSSGLVWRFPTSLDAEALAAAPRHAHVPGLTHLATLQLDVVVPHMFCLPGLTTFRALFDVLGVPYLGSSADVQALVSNKAIGRHVVKAAGVPVPDAQVLVKGQHEAPSMAPPYMVKPCAEANSIGISLVKTESEAPAAIASAFEYDDQVLIERFIPPGREIRVGVLELADGSLRVLPAVEYFLTEDHPIRLASDKLLTDASGNPSGFAKPSGGRKCPADVSAELMAKLGDAAIRAHKALGARDYSIYDMRVDPQGDVFFLESSLFCSFAPSSVIMLMAAATDDLELNETFRMIVRRAASRSLKGQEIDVTRTTMKASRAA